MKPEMKKSVYRWFVAIVVVVLIVGGLGGYKWREVQAEMAAFQSQPEYAEIVETIAVTRTDFAQTVKAAGVVVAPQSIVLRNEISGKILSVNAEPGSVVQKGDIILQLENGAEQATLASQKAREKLAKSIFARNRRLNGSKIVSAAVLDRARAELDVIRAEITATGSALRKKQIVAPFDGVLGIHQIEVGQLLEANSLIAPLVGKTGYVWVDFSLPQFYGELPVGLDVGVRVIRAEQSADTMTGTIIAADSVVSASSRSLLYRVQVNDELLHNTAVEVIIPVREFEALAELPAIALQKSSTGSHVWALDPDEKAGGYRARRVTVSVEGQRDQNIYVSGELSEGQVVAASGSFKLFDGLLVHDRAQKSGDADNGGW